MSETNVAAPELDENGRRRRDPTQPNSEILAMFPVDVEKDPYDMPLEDLNVAHPALWKANKFERYFERMRAEDPVHYCFDSQYGPYWSITKFNDIMAIDTNHKVFSSDSELGGITVMGEPREEGMEKYRLPMFIAMDPPKHDQQRKAVSPVVAPPNLAELEGVIRERAALILDGLPINEEFNWVEHVSVELTGRMLATIFGIPQEDRHKLIRWSDVAGNLGNPEVVESVEAGFAELFECAHYFTEVWKEREAAGKPGNDLISMMLHSESTRNMPPEEYLGNLILLIVGGNDTTRNSISGGVLALNQNPAEYDKLRANPDLATNMMSEIIRWQTPLAHMRRTALVDTEFGGKQIKAGDKVVMWYISGNRDEEAIKNANEFIIDRERARHHMSFGFGVHRCMGNRLAEMQLRILWEEIMKRFQNIEVVGEPERVFSCFVKGYSDLPVIIRG